MYRISKIAAFIRPNLWTFLSFLGFTCFLGPQLCGQREPLPQHHWPASKCQVLTLPSLGRPTSACPQFYPPQCELQWPQSRHEFPWHSQRHWLLLPCISRLRVPYCEAWPLASFMAVLHGRGARCTTRRNMGVKASWGKPVNEFLQFLFSDGYVVL